MYNYPRPPCFLCGVSDPKNYYIHRREENEALARRLRGRYDRLALLRLVGFVAVLAILILAYSQGWAWGLGASALLLPLTVWAVRRHQNIALQGARARVQAELAKAEVDGQEHSFSYWPDGGEYRDPAHPYTGDLDIFGPYSLYQFINRTVTAVGHRRLAEQLMHPAPHAVARARRDAALPLVDDPDWMLAFRTTGHDLKDDPAYARQLLDWLRRPEVVMGDGFARLMLWLAPVLSLLGLYLIFTLPIWQLGVLPFVPAIVLLRRYGEVISREHEYTARAGKVLGGYAELLRHAETRYPALEGASREVGRLGYYASQLDVRYNPFVWLLELTGLWSLQWLYRLDRWRNDNRDSLPRWLDELAELDARISWATLRFNQPGWAEAELTDVPEFTATGLGHPLLPPTTRVTNDIEMRTDGHIHLVTGSNMAGKSTWLRTVGMNLVLARAGAPVCARHLRAAALQVWTSMRTHDDLSESTSSFYAELKRLKAIIEAVSQPEKQVFFLLDEILKGTNSRDRHTGSRALIRQLIRERGAGVIATHDLELAALEDEAGSRVENYAMEVQTQGDRLTFDYKLRRGVSQSFNATALMAQMGIAIDPADIKLTHD